MRRKRRAAVRNWANIFVDFLYYFAHNEAGNTGSGAGGFLIPKGLHSSSSA
jgi:hypothetical protein